jgi:ankyrin repeat protein
LVSTFFLASEARLTYFDSVSRTFSADDIIPQLLTHGADINARDCEGNTVLHWVRKDNLRGRESTISTLLRLGADVNAQNICGETILHSFSFIGGSINESQKTLHTIIDAGANLELRDRRGRTILHRALEERTGMADVLLEHRKRPLVSARTSFSGKTVLHIACQSKQPWKVIDRMICLGADPLWVDNEGNTVLHEIASHFEDNENDCALLGSFVKLGVSVHAQNHRGQTVAHIIRPDSTEHRSHQTNHRQERNLIATLLRLDSSFDINALDMDAYTPLHVAAAISEPYAYALLQAGADVNAKSFKLETPLHCAARGRQCGIISMILFMAAEKGVSINVDAQDENGRTPLHYACRSGRPESVKLLMDAGADVHKVDKLGATMLMVCAEFEDEKARWHYMLTDGYTKRKVQVERMGGMYNSYSFPDIHPHTDVRTEHSTARIGVIARMLMDAGVPYDGAPQVARSAQSAELLTALRPAEHSQWRSFSDGMLFLPHDKFGCVLDEYGSNGPLTTVAHFLPGLGESAMDELLARGVDFTKVTDNYHLANSTPVGKIVRLGLTEHMRKLITKAKLYDNLLHWTDEEIAKHNLQIIPLLQAACQRHLWSMDMVRLLVETGEVDVNARQLTEDRSDHRDIKKVLGKTALHLLAEGNSWWHLEAIRYLVKRGMFLSYL